jgi:hypothetical protein
MVTRIGAVVQAYNPRSSRDKEQLKGLWFKANWGKKLVRPHLYQCEGMVFGHANCVERPFENGLVLVIKYLNKAY